MSEQPYHTLARRLTLGFIGFGGLLAAGYSSIRRPIGPRLHLLRPLHRVRARDQILSVASNIGSRIRIVPALRPLVRSSQSWVAMLSSSG